MRVPETTATRESVSRNPWLRREGLGGEALAPPVSVAGIVSRLLFLRHGALKGFFDLGPIEVPSDENKLARPALFLLPQTVPVKCEPIIDAVKNSAARCSLNPEESFRSVN